MTEHTPTPWAADPDDREGMEWNVHIVEAARPHMRIAFTSNGPSAEANAAFIVQAVNNHGALVKALRAAKDFADDEFSWTGDLNHKNRVSNLCDLIDAALAAVSSPSTEGGNG